MSRLTVIVASLLVLSPLWSQPESTAGGTARTVVAFYGARLIPGEGAPPIEDAVLVSENGTIARLGPRAEVEIPAGAERVDLSGKTVMPVLVSLHAHLGWAEGATFAKNNFTPENIVNQLRQLERLGIGAVLSLGTDASDNEFRVRDEQRAGRFGGAVFHTAGRGFVAADGGPTVAPLEHVPYEVAGVDEALARLLELAGKHPDMVKVWVDDRGGTKPKLRPEIYRALIKEAHDLGLRVMAHVYYLEDAKDLLRAGVDGFAHMVRDREIDEELISLAKEREVFFCTAMSGHETLIHREEAPWIRDPLLAEILPADALRQVSERLRRAAETSDSQGRRRTYALLQRNVQKLAASGVRVALGADSGIPNQFLGFAEHRELEAMVSAGMAPLEVIQAATSTSARILGLNDLGSLAPGKRADFIVLDANPVEDIRNTRHISSIYRLGRPVGSGRP